MKKYNIIFDTSNFVHRAYHVFKFKIQHFNLNNAQHRAKLIRKIMIDYQSIIKTLPVGNVFFCFDSNSFRKDIYKQYKSHRSNNDGLDLVFEELYKLFKFKKINAIKEEGLEADDCIAVLCEILENNIIISQDEDLRQLVNENTYVLTPINRNRTLYKSFDSGLLDIPNVEVKEIDPKYILIEKLLKGCKSDNIPRLVEKSIRRTTINNILKEFTLDLSMLVNVLNKNKINTSNEQVKNQLRLVGLKSEFMPQESVEEIRKADIHHQLVSNLHMDNILSNTIYWL